MGVGLPASLHPTLGWTLGVLFSPRVDLWTCLHPRFGLVAVWVLVWSWLWHCAWLLGPSGLSCPCPCVLLAWANPPPTTTSGLNSIYPYLRVSRSLCGPLPLLLVLLLTCWATSLSSRPLHRRFGRIAPSRLCLLWLSLCGIPLLGSVLWNQGTLSCDPLLAAHLACLCTALVCVGQHCRVRTGLLVLGWLVSGLVPSEVAASAVPTGHLPSTLGRASTQFSGLLDLQANHLQVFSLLLALCWKFGRELSNLPVFP